jgi:hypothetical protein
MKVAISSSENSVLARAPCVTSKKTPFFTVTAVKTSNLTQWGKMRWARLCSANREKRNVYSLLVGKPEGKRPLGRPRRRWIDDIKMDLVEIGCGGLDWIGVAQDRDKWRALVNEVMNLLVP